MKNRIVLLSSALALGLFLTPVQASAGEHGAGMEHCMPGMEGHCKMQKEMDSMQKDMGAMKDMEHCMPEMATHCQDIADMQYMDKRMEAMQRNVQHCMKNMNDKVSCQMPEMMGEMGAMRKMMHGMMGRMKASAKAQPVPQAEHQKHHLNQ